MRMTRHASTTIPACRAARSRAATLAAVADLADSDRRGVVGITLVVRFLSERGPTITISFNTAEGIVAGKTRIKYKEVEIGTVQNVRLAEDRSSIIATVQLLKEARRFHRQGHTLLGGPAERGSNRHLRPGHLVLRRLHRCRSPAYRARSRSRFEGLETPPIVTRDESGKQFVLQADDLGSLDIGSPVYYRRIKVGQVAAYSLDEDGKGVTLRIFVNSPYEKYVGANTRFWHASGFDVQVDAGGVRLRTQSLATVILGGIAFQSPDGKQGPEAPENTAFGLAADQGTALAADDGPPEVILMHFNQSLRGLAPGCPGGFPGSSARPGQVDRRRLRSQGG